MPRSTRWVIRLVRPLLRLSVRRDWQYTARLPRGGCVIAPNHLSHVDPLYVGLFLVDQGLAPRFLAKHTLMSLPLLGPLLQAMEQIPVYRSSEGAAQSLRAAIAAVEAGQAITIYPEGTITRDPQAWPMSGRTGAVRVALATGAPLVPVAQWGAQEILWPYSRRLRLLPRRTVQMRVGEPLDLDDLRAQPLTEALLHEGTERLMAAITAMLTDLRGEQPEHPPIDVHTIVSGDTHQDAAASHADDAPHSDRGAH